MYFLSTNQLNKSHTNVRITLCQMSEPMSNVNLVLQLPAQTQVSHPVARPVSVLILMPAVKMECVSVLLVSSSNVVPAVSVKLLRALIEITNIYLVCILN